MKIEELFEHFSDETMVSVVSAKNENNKVDNCNVGQIRISLLSTNMVQAWNFNGTVNITVP